MIPVAREVIKLRTEQGPIQDAAQLAKILGGEPATGVFWERVDSALADASAAEAPGGTRPVSRSRS